MYNLLITATDGAWELDAYEFGGDRFLEYTKDSIASRYVSLTAEHIEELKAFPTLFCYEGKDEPVRVGYITHIRRRGRAVLIEYEIEDSIESFTFDKLDAIKEALDIRDWENSRTHWAVKDRDLFAILANAGLVDPELSRNESASGPIEKIRFKVALSFPGEKREYVAAVAAELKKRLGKDAVFYDKDFTAQLARPNLDTLLQNIYLKNSDLVVVFLCAEYEKKAWCGIEWRAIRTIIKNKNDEAIMFMRFDGTAVSGVMEFDGYVDLADYTPQGAAKLIAERAMVNEKAANDA